MATPSSELTAGHTTTSYPQSWHVFGVNVPQLPEIVERYIFQELVSDNHFRVLELFPASYRPSGSTQRPGLHGSLVEHDLTDPLDYDCLSYTWGGAPRDSFIWLGERVVDIGETLWMALYTMQHEDESRYLWADQICINQADLDERNQQVQHMYTIYSRASRVIAWLGDSEDGSDELPSLFINLKESYQGKNASGKLFWTEEDCVARGLPPPRDVAWTRLSKFLLRPWFVRAWIVQEIVAAKRLWVSCGMWSVAAVEVFIPMLDVLGQVPGLARLAKVDDQLISDATSRVHELFELICRLEPTWTTDEAIKGSSKLIDILEMVWYSKATDPRDKVFAFLNLANDTKQLDIRPNYRAETNQLFVQVARSIVKAGQGGCLLLNAGISGSTLAMPSWVPDWSLEGRPEPLFVELRDFYDIAREGAELEKNSIRVSELTDELFVCVFGIDYVAHLDFGHSSKDSPSQRDQRPRESNGNWPPHYAPENPNIGRDATLEAVPTVESIPESSNDEFKPQSTESICHMTTVALRYVEQSPIYAKQNPFDVLCETLLCDPKSRWRGDDLQAYLAFARSAAREGDVLVIIKGVKGPMVIRYVNDRNFKLVGAAFLAGFMYGEEIIAELERVEDFQDFVLI
ncbi:hypothetical protein LTR37_015452 [Vermiconidia calcicola]|uniref:Uncharacterized protein n=1 Tax=Vermiconidia calcicola TaxID=1690605 RepID=A0ACC3MQP4_9PEZI|nr:hypothetical protein LTR37_015452 [Vermiconidia calcicola]